MYVVYNFLYKDENTTLAEAEEAMLNLYIQRSGKVSTFYEEIF